MLDKKDKYNTIEGAMVPAIAFAERAIRELCYTLEINVAKTGWRKDLEPFVPIAVAMITAAMRDYEIEWAERIRITSEP